MKSQLNYQSDYELYLALKNKENTAYSYLYSMLYNSVHNWIRKNNGNNDDADDILQEGILGFLINVEFGKYVFSENTKLTTVIFGYCKLKWLTELEKRKKWAKETLDGIEIHDNLANLETEIINKENIEKLKNAINQLKADCQQVINLFYIEELSLREISQQFGWQENSAKQKRYNCFEKLKLILKPKPSN